MPLYREVIAHDTREGGTALLWLLAPELHMAKGVRARFMTALRGWVDAPPPGGLRLMAGGVAGQTAWLRLVPLRAACLRTWLVGTRPSMEQALGIIGRVARQVSAAHERCWLHGLLTPRDVLVAERGLTLGGFGLWSQLDRKPVLAALWHEAHCLAPEVRAGGEPGLGADLYAVGAIAAELLQASAGMTTAALRGAGWHPLLLEAVDRLLTDDPGRRPSSLAALETALAMRVAAPVRRGTTAAPREPGVLHVPSRKVALPAAVAPRKAVARLSEVLRAIDEVDDDAVTNRQRSSERTSVRPSRGNLR